MLNTDNFLGKLPHLKISLPLACCILSNHLAQVEAQIIPDQTLPTNTEVLPPNTENLMEILGGTRAGNNLFHSFEEFSVPTDLEVFFNNATDINNIINRVTGGSISNIDGLIRANGVANFFLINPNGIVFGPNAILDIGGSFFASTADAIQFTDGSFYSAVNPQEPPLLTINMPLGLQYGSNPGEIVVQGSGNNLFFDPDTFATVRDERPVGLQVPLGKTLALVGGNLTLEGGNLTAEEGRIELGSVQGEGVVNLTSTATGWSLDYEQVSDFQNIDLVFAASVDVTGNSGGEVQVVGENIFVADGSAIIGNTEGDGQGGTLTIQATENVEVVGFSFDLPFSTTISTDVGFSATGDGGSIDINTQNLVVTDGAQIGSGTFGIGNGGVVRVQATDIQLIFGGPDGPSGLFTTAEFGTGNGGTVLVETDTLAIIDGASIASQTFSDGNAGDLDIKARDIQLLGTAFGEFPGGLSSNTFSSISNGGNITVETETLQLIDGAQIQASTFGSGNAGEVNIQSQEIAIAGGSEAGVFSGIFANVEADGNGGLVSIATGSLQLLDGGQIATAVIGTGTGGTLSVTAQTIELRGVLDTVPSGLYSDADFGQGGDLSIETITLSLSEGAQIGATTFGNGNGGNVTIQAEEIDLSGVGVGGSSGLFNNAIIGSGDGGTLTINTGKLTVTDGATITASNFSSNNQDLPPGLGQAGTIEINGNTLELDSNDPEQPASITASTFAGGGGSITLNFDEVSLENGSEITAQARGISDGGTISLTADTLSVTNAAVISTSSEDLGDGGTINLTADLINLESGGQITSDSTNLGQAGEIQIFFDRLETNQGLITATSEQSGGGNITLTALGSEIILRDNSLISTSVFDSTGGGGNITINTDLLLALENSDIRANAVLGDGGNIQINAETLFLSPDSDINASSQFGVDGVVTVNTSFSKLKNELIKLDTGILNRDFQLARNCGSGDSGGGNTFVITGRGGLPSSPHSLNIDNIFLIDWGTIGEMERQREMEIRRGGDGERSPITNLPLGIVEAQGWIINEEGKIELVAYASNVTPENYWQSHGNCSG